MLQELFFLVVIVLVVAVWNTKKLERSENQKRFVLGTIPGKPLDGFYSGTAPANNIQWRGKKFDASNMRGINVLQENSATVERYPFVTKYSSGARDHSTQVLAIDYNIPSNPWWLRPVLDEVVEVAPGQYLGKMHVRLIPGWPFTVLFFELKK